MWVFGFDIAPHIRWKIVHFVMSSTRRMLEFGENILYRKTRESDSILSRLQWSANAMIALTASDGHWLNEKVATKSLTQIV